MSSEQKLSDAFIKLMERRTKDWSMKDWENHKIEQVKKGKPYLYFNEHGIKIMNPNDMDYGRKI